MRVRSRGFQPSGLGGIVRRGKTAIGIAVVAGVGLPGALAFADAGSGSAQSAATVAASMTEIAPAALAPSEAIGGGIQPRFEPEGEGFVVRGSLSRAGADADPAGGAWLETSAGRLGVKADAAGDAPSGQRH